MKKIITIILLLILTNCSLERPTQFSKESLEEIVINWNKENTLFKDVLEQNKGKKILIDIWASWCKDCIVNLPKLKKFQKDNPNVSYVFISIDKGINRWQRAVTSLQIKGQHYFMPLAKKGALGDFLNLWWIPRYVVVNETGEISLFKATKITDKRIAEALK